MYRTSLSFYVTLQILQYVRISFPVGFTILSLKLTIN